MKIDRVEYHCPDCGLTYSVPDPLIISSDFPVCMCGKPILELELVRREKSAETVTLVEV